MRGVERPAHNMRRARKKQAGAGAGLSRRILASSQAALLKSALACVRPPYRFLVERFVLRAAFLVERLAVFLAAFLLVGI